LSAVSSTADDKAEIAGGQSWAKCRPMQRSNKLCLFGEGSVSAWDFGPTITLFVGKDGHVSLGELEIM